MDILDELETRVLPGDGAMGTMLLDAGVPFQDCLEELCVSQPGLVASVHEQYIAAGARVIETNSFGANAVRLDKHGLASRVNELNWTAARLARDAARGKQVYVAGSVGPLGITAAQAAARGIDRQTVYQDQIGALLDGGVDLIFFETFGDFDELALVLEIKESLHHCPAICSLACPADGRLGSGMLLADAFAQLHELGAAVVGLNCTSEGPCGLLQLLKEVPSEGLISAYPNAGDPVYQDGRFVYNLAPAEFAAAALDLAAEGARLIGGGCGTRPEHIAALAEAIRA